MDTTPRDQACSLIFPLTLIQKPLGAEVTPSSTVLWMSFNNDDSAPVEPVFVSRADYYRLARHPTTENPSHSTSRLRSTNSETQRGASTENTWIIVEAAVRRRPDGVSLSASGCWRSQLRDRTDRMVVQEPTIITARSCARSTIRLDCPDKRR